MSVKIALIDTGVATITDGRWKPSNRIMRTLLIGIDARRLRHDVGYHPFPDLGIAELAVTLIGAEIIEITDQPTFEKEVVY